MRTKYQTVTFHILSVLSSQQMPRTNPRSHRSDSDSSMSCSHKLVSSQLCSLLLFNRQMDVSLYKHNT